MSDLQLTLLAVGAVFILAVILYNTWKEHQYKVRTAAAFSAYQQESLVDPTLTLRDTLQEAGDSGIQPDDPRDWRSQHAFESPMNGRRKEDSTEAAGNASHQRSELSPKIGAELPEATAAAAAAFSAAMASAHRSSAREMLSYPNQQDPKVDAIAQLSSQEALDIDLIYSLHRQLQLLGKRISWLALTESGQWGPLELDAQLMPMGLKVGLQLVDRRGPVDETLLRRWLSELETFSQQSSAELRCSPLNQLVADAENLDNFCANVDVTIGLNVVASAATFEAAAVRDHLERAHLKLMADGAYHYVNERGRHLYSVINMDNTPFKVNNSQRNRIDGLTLLFDVPRVNDGLNAFGYMSDLAFELASQLGGQLVDDRRKTLSDHSIASIRQQLRALYGTMKMQGIDPGSPTAMRLFT